MRAGLQRVQMQRWLRWPTWKSGRSTYKKTVKTRFNLNIVHSYIMIGTPLECLGRDITWMAWSQRYPGSRCINTFFSATWHNTHRNRLPDHRCSNLNLNRKPLPRTWAKYCRSSVFQIPGYRSGGSQMIILEKYCEWLQWRTVAMIGTLKLRWPSWILQEKVDRLAALPILVTHPAGQLQVSFYCLNFFIFLPKLSWWNTDQYRDSLVTVRIGWTMPPRYLLAFCDAEAELKFRPPSNTDFPLAASL